MPREWRRIGGRAGKLRQALIHKGADARARTRPGKWARSGEVLKPCPAGSRPSACQLASFSAVSFSTGSRTTPQPTRRSACVRPCSSPVPARPSNRTPTKMDSTRPLIARRRPGPADHAVAGRRAAQSRKLSAAMGPAATAKKGMAAGVQQAQKQEASPDAQPPTGQYAAGEGEGNDTQECKQEVGHSGSAGEVERLEGSDGQGAEGRVIVQAFHAGGEAELAGQREGMDVVRVDQARREARRQNDRKTPGLDGRVALHQLTGEVEADGQRAEEKPLVEVHPQRTARGGTTRPSAVRRRGRPLRGAGAAAPAATASAPRTGRRRPPVAGRAGLRASTHSAVSATATHARSPGRRRSAA